MFLVSFTWIENWSSRRTSQTFLCTHTFLEVEHGQLCVGGVVHQNWPQSHVPVHEQGGHVRGWRHRESLQLPEQSPQEGDHRLGVVLHVQSTHHQMHLHAWCIQQPCTKWMDLQESCKKCQNLPETDRFCEKCKILANTVLTSLNFKIAISLKSPFCKPSNV